MIDPTITIGNLIEAGAFIFTVIGAFFGLRSSVTGLKQEVGNFKEDMTDMKAEIKKVGDVLVTLAVANKRLDNVEDDIRELKHGRGFIQARADGGINGEY